MRRGSDRRDLAAQRRLGQALGYRGGEETADPGFDLRLARLSDAALGDPRLDAWRARQQLVSETGIFNKVLNKKFMILVKSNPDLEARLAAMSDPQMRDSMAAMGVFNEELQDARNH